MPLALILAAGAVLRLYGMDWDGGFWLHPDERQIYFVVDGLSWPQTLGQAFSPASPLNPHFFAYGSLPIYLLKLVSTFLAWLVPLLRDPGNLHLVGRPLAALIDLGTVALTYRLAMKLDRINVHAGQAEGQGTGTPGGPEGSVGSAPAGRRRPRPRASARLAAALVALAVLPVQLAHFYTADPLLTLLVMLTLNRAADVAWRGGWRRQVALGVALGLALATKLTAAPLVLVAVAALTLPSPRGRGFAPVLVTGLVAGGVFFAVQPYALIDWRTFVADTLRESQIAWGRLDVPYTRQYAGTLPFLYSIGQTSLWGLGLPLGLSAWAGFAASLVRWLRRGPWADTLLLAWAVPYLAMVGVFHARPLRYMLPLVPVLCIMAAWLLNDLGRWVRRLPSVAVRWGVVLLTAAYALAFIRLYASPHSWITASEWLYRNAPAGSTLAVEEWDTPLPLPLDVDGQARRIEEYGLRTLTLYDEPDGAAKWSRLAADLAASDYVIVASRRLYGSIPRLPNRYPVTSRYYGRLFAGELGFQLAGEFTRGPVWLNPRCPPLPDAAPPYLLPDESFVVYDHPRALILRNVEHLTAKELLGRLGIP